MLAASRDVMRKQKLPLPSKGSRSYKGDRNAHQRGRVRAQGFGELREPEGRRRGGRGLGFGSPKSREGTQTPQPVGILEST